MMKELKISLGFIGLIAALIFIAAAGPAQAGANQWTTTGPYGGYFSALAVRTTLTPVPTETVYAGKARGGVFKTSDGGSTWTQINDGLLSSTISASKIEVDSLAIDPAGTVYAGIMLYSAPSGVFKMVGGTWTNVYNSNSVHFQTTNALAIDTAGTVYAGLSIDGIVKTINGGTTWTPINGTSTTILPTDSNGYINVRALAVDSTNNIVYAGTDGNKTSSGGVYKTTDGGTTWTATDSTHLPPSDVVSSLAVDPANSNTVYAGTLWGGVFKTTNGGTSWTNINGATLTHNYITSLTISGGTVYAGTDGGPFYSTDGGASWTQGNAAQVNALATGTAGTVYAGTLGGVSKTTDGGTTWNNAIGTGLTAITYSLTADTVGKVYAGTDGGVFETANSSMAWTQINAGLATWDDLTVWSLTTDTNGTVYAGGHNCGVHKWSGTAWTQINGTSPTNLTNLYVHSLAADTAGAIYAGTEGGVLSTATSNPGAWAQINTSLSTVYALAVYPSGTVYAGTNAAGVFKMTYAGGSWTTVNTGSSVSGLSYVRSLAVDTVGTVYEPAGTVYAGTGACAGVFKTTDGGTSWTNINGTSLTSTCVYALAVAAGAVYAGTDAGGVFMTIDGGTSWTQINTGLTNTNILALSVDTAGVVYAGTNGGGVFAYTPAPTVSSFAPTSGSIGTSVTITGTSLTGATAVIFGGTAAQSFTVNSGTQITAVVGSGATGTISVTTPGGSANSGTFTFIPSTTITSTTTAPSTTTTTPPSTTTSSTGPTTTTTTTAASPTTPAATTTTTAASTTTSTTASTTTTIPGQGYTLTVVNDPANGGTISGDMTCPGTCSKQFPANTLVSLTANGLSNYGFFYWGVPGEKFSDSRTLMSRTLTLTINSNLTVTAFYIPFPVEAFH
ncbi:MAG: hypothetical protein HQK59_12330 [Deltaproteobacteria bacterium]|nr:hypothetical protein [Deltaproteobacteria bacterium]